MSKDTYDTFLAEILQGVPDDRRAAIEGTLRDDQIAPKMRERVLARTDYSRSMDALRQERETFQRDVAEARSRIEGWTQWYGTASQQVDQLKRENDHYKSTYGDLDGAGAPARPAPGLTQAQMEARMTDEFNKRDQQAIAFADVLTELKIDHREAFKEKLDTQALLRFATEQNLPLASAYREFVAPRVEEQQKERHEADLKRAREEGAASALSQHRLPTASGYSEPHVLDQTATAGKTQQDRVRAAVTHWNDQSAHSVF